MLFLINPRHEGKKMAKTTRKKAPSRKQLAARRKFVAMVRAKSKAARAGKKKSTTRRKRTRRSASAVTTSAGGSTVAKRRKRRATGSSGTTTRHRRRSHKRRSVRRAGYRSNPRMMDSLMALVTDTGLVLAGGAGAKFISDMIPIGAASDHMTNALKGGAIAAGIELMGARFVGRQKAHMLAVGALENTMRALIVQVVPEAGSYLSSYATGSRRLSGPSVPLKFDYANMPSPTRRLVRPGMNAYAQPAHLGNYAPGNDQPM